MKREAEWRDTENRRDSEATEILENLLPIFGPGWSHLEQHTYLTVIRQLEAQFGRHLAGNDSEHPMHMRSMEFRPQFLDKQTAIFERPRL